jgi:hypothetical protein
MEYSIVKIKKGADSEVDFVRVANCPDKKTLRKVVDEAGIRPHEDGMLSSNGIHRDSEGNQYLFFQRKPMIMEVVYRI